MSDKISRMHSSSITSSCDLKLSKTRVQAWVACFTTTKYLTATQVNTKPILNLAIQAIVSFDLWNRID